LRPFARRLQTATVIENPDRPALADQLDPSGRYRRALRSALLKALDDRSRSDDRSCERGSSRAPHCTTHGGGRTPGARAEH
jgi:hypothetical protein